MPDAKQGYDALYRTLEADAAAIAVYDAAIGCATDPALRVAWQRRRDEKEAGMRELRSAMRALALDPQAQTPSRHVLRHVGQSLACAVKVACQSVAPGDAESVAAQCIVHAEAGCRHHWMLVARVARAFGGDGGKRLRALAAVRAGEQQALLDEAQRTLDQSALAALGLPDTPAAVAFAPCDDALLPVPWRAGSTRAANRPRA